VNISWHAGAVINKYKKLKKNNQPAATATVVPSQHKQGDSHCMVAMALQQLLLHSSQCCRFEK